MKKLLVLWVSTVAALLGGTLYYAVIRSQYTTRLDAQSMDAYRHADDMVALYLMVLLAVIFIGPLLFGILAGYQSYREAHPRQPIKDSYEGAYKSRLVYLAPISLTVFLTGVVGGILGESYSTVAVLLILGAILGAIAKVNYARYAELMDVKTHGNHTRRSCP